MLASNKNAKAETVDHTWAKKRKNSDHLQKFPLTRIKSLKHGKFQHSKASHNVSSMNPSFNLAALFSQTLKSTILLITEKKFVCFGKLSKETFSKIC